MKKAFITGVTGQDGSYLAELLLEQGYEVHGLVRRASSDNTERIKHLHPSVHDQPQIRLHVGDLTDSQALTRLILEIEPDEIYNLGAQSHVHVSFDLPVYTMMANGLGALGVLEAARQLQATKPVKVYQASSSEMYGKVAHSPQNEQTPFHPQSPYACSKVYAFHQTVNYREAFGIFACNGILFNHESPRRGETFVTRKITRAAARIKLGLQDKLYLGNLESRRDWGYAKDYVVAMWKMLQADRPLDLVIGTGRSTSVLEFAELAFAAVGLKSSRHIEVHESLQRPSDVAVLTADPKLALLEIGWESATSIEELVDIMISRDIELAKKEANDSK